MNCETCEHPDRDHTLGFGGCEAVIHDTLWGGDFLCNCPHFERGADE